MSRLLRTGNASLHRLRNASQLRIFACFLTARAKQIQLILSCDNDDELCVKKYAEDDNYYVEGQQNFQLSSFPGHPHVVDC